MDDGGKALVGFVASHGDALELFELAEEVFDQMAPFVHFCIERQRLGATWMLRDDDLGAALIEVCNDDIAVEGLVGDQRVKREAIDQRRHAHAVEAMTGQEHEADEIAQRVGQREDLGGHAALGAADGLVLSPPFAPWP